MSLSLDRCIYTSDQSDEIVLSFSDSKCSSTRLSENFLISTHLDECATITAVEEDEIVFKNTIRIKERANRYGIVLNTDVDINVQDMI